MDEHGKACTTLPSPPPSPRTTNYIAPLDEDDCTNTDDHQRRSNSLDVPLIRVTSYDDSDDGATDLDGKGLDKNGEKKPSHPADSNGHVDKHVSFVVHNHDSGKCAEGNGGGKHLGDGGEGGGEEGGGSEEDVVIVEQDRPKRLFYKVSESPPIHSLIVFALQVRGYCCCLCSFLDL